jgi:hypothetical protein
MGCSGLALSIISDHRKQAKRERDDGPRSARQQFRIQGVASQRRWVGGNRFGPVNSVGVAFNLMVAPPLRSLRRPAARSGTAGF